MLMLNCRYCGKKMARSDDKWVCNYCKSTMSVVERDGEKKVIWLRNFPVGFKHKNRKIVKIKPDRKKRLEQQVLAISEPQEEPEKLDFQEQKIGRIATQIEKRRPRYVFSEGAKHEGVSDLLFGMIQNALQ